MEQIKLKTEIDPILGIHPLLLRAKRLTARAESLRILFYGETGVGKTPFARYSNRLLSKAQGKDRPFEQINCACLSPEQFHDQMFGHKRGAFTGAIHDKAGLVELARGGDLFLDEIGDMPLSTQGHFLTFLDNLEFYRLGEDRKRKAEVRILCATNRDLKAMVAKGTFRQDLYSRISQVTVEIPPLRERKSDIPLLFEHFIREFCNGPRSYGSDLVEALQRYSWKEGNVRELRDLTEYLCLMSREAGKIEIHHLGDRLLALSERSQGPAQAAQVADLSEALPMVYQIGLEGYLDLLERSVLEAVLRDRQGSIEGLASHLKTSRSTLYRRLKKHESFRLFEKNLADG